MVSKNNLLGQFAHLPFVIYCIVSCFFKIKATILEDPHACTSRNVHLHIRNGMREVVAEANAIKIEIPVLG